MFPLGLTAGCTPITAPLHTIGLGLGLGGTRLWCCLSETNPGYPKGHAGGGGGGTFPSSALTPPRYGMGLPAPNGSTWSCLVAYPPPPSPLLCTQRESVRGDSSTSGAASVEEAVDVRLKPQQVLVPAHALRAVCAQSTAGSPCRPL